MNRAIACSFVALIVATGCGAAPRLIASPDDYAEYRDVRSAPGWGERLSLAAQYLERRPRGAFAGELRALYDEEEPRYFERAKETRFRTLEYLTLLPHGPHVEAAQSLLVAWDTKLEEGENATLLAQARRTEAVLEGAAVQRQQVVETIYEGLRALADPHSYATSVDDAGPLLRKFLAGTGGPTWGKMPHEATREMFFVVPTKLERESRLLTLTLTTKETTGKEPRRVTELSLHGPDFFVAWLEAETMTALDPTLPQHRERASQHARERLEGFFEAIVPKSRCPGAGTDTPGVILDRACDGWVVRARLAPRTATSATEEDTVIVTH